MKDRIRVHAGGAIRRKVDCLVVPEVDDKHGLHFHCIVVATPAERHALQEVMCEADGPWAKWRNMQVHMHDDPPDSGWVSYSCKGLDKASPWPRYAATNPLRNAAHAAFDAMRAFVIDCDQDIEDKSSLTSNVALATSGACLTKALASPDLDRFAARCGHLTEAGECSGRK